MSLGLQSEEEPPHRHPSSSGGQSLPKGRSLTHPLPSRLPLLPASRRMSQPSPVSHRCTPARLQTLPLFLTVHGFPLQPRPVRHTLLRPCRSLLLPVQDLHPHQPPLSGQHPQSSDRAGQSRHLSGQSPSEEAGSYWLPCALLHLPVQVPLPVRSVEVLPVLPLPRALR